MFLTLPWIVILAGLLYLLASKAGWLEAFSRWWQRPRPPGGRHLGPPGPPSGGGEASPRRLEVFEEFLRSLGRDDSQDS
jgi:hypothetical protein